jgi:hypothetical protein
MEILGYFILSVIVLLVGFIVLIIGLNTIILLMYYYKRRKVERSLLGWKYTYMKALKENEWKKK